ncbi:plasmid pRiA4b ORF-3 family protein [Desulfosporosinus sp. FKA]|uniref:plasmid pRiA4b ORF-3 family protein n=1 Tax=Desulfosporosinus sp. FKA TaxID=1969834 RepID=UPI000B49CD4F|nr:plasmid pRiA4b ORF-3 family protein [Desulfosporosinus sp. FKA]
MFEITTTYLTPLLQDFKRFIDSLKTEEAVLSPKNHYMSKELLWELNQLMCFKTKNANPKLGQGSYPLLHMFCHLALVSKLVVMMPSKGGRFHLKVSERYEEYLKLTMTEQYFFLLETLWVDVDWEALQKVTDGRILNVRNISSVWQELAWAKPGKTLNVKGTESSWHSLLFNWGNFLWYFTYFGFWQFTLDKEAQVGSRRNIKAKTLTPTEFGVTIAPILYKYRDYLDWNRVNIRKGNLTSQVVLEGQEIIMLSMGKILHSFTELTQARQESLEEPFYKKFVSLVPKGELMHTLTRGHFDITENMYLFKVSLSRGKWRRIEMAAKHNLHQLHLAIQEAFEFGDDYLYSFFMDNKKWSDDRYDSSSDEGTRADKVSIEELGLYPGKTFLYLFDFGNGWEFKVEVEGIHSHKPLPLIPRVVGRRGEAPDQYGHK